jgi:hypothetical protein
VPTSCLLLWVCGGPETTGRAPVRLTVKRNYPHPPCQAGGGTIAAGPWRCGIAWSCGPE